ncbi:MAG: glycosyltransferase family 2 protein [Crocinitomicaceae bacterium]|nr:glycosyltransferase family 2 protein [Crocinitomicaceae bacterium]MCF8433565.1 glycosyltransferase family 2 protein [Crocinitomicaceae bacterium]
MNSPLVSFIIPYFNAGTTINETIDSIFNQSYPHFDIWLINDGSTDQFSLDQLKQFEGNEKIHLLNQENAGPSVARNKAIQLSSAEFIVPLDADDLVGTTAISECVHRATSDKDIGVVYGNLHFFGESTEQKIQQVFSIERQLLWNQIAVCCLIRKEVFTSVGYYDEYLSKLGLEDWEFWLRVGQSPWKFSKIEHVHFRIRVVGSSRTFEVANKNLNLIKDYVYQKHCNSLIRAYEKKYYEYKMLKETPDFKIGKFLLTPYRFIKKKLFRNE